MEIQIGWPELTLGGLLFAALQSLLALWIGARFKSVLQRENSVFLENLRWEQKVREQATRVAEYLAVARDLKAGDSPEKYERANRLSWELALWMPADNYRALGRALSSPNQDTNELTVVVNVRSSLLGEGAGDLTAEEIIHHAPGIGAGS